MLVEDSSRREVLIHKELMPSAEQCPVSPRTSSMRQKRSRYNNTNGEGIMFHLQSD
jgi:hypothetical protein